MLYLCDAADGTAKLLVGLDFGMSPAGSPGVLRGASAFFFPVLSFDLRHAARAWEVALRLKEQGSRMGMPHGIRQSFPESALGLEVLEGQIQVAKCLANATGITATCWKAWSMNSSATEPEERPSDDGNTDQ